MSQGVNAPVEIPVPALYGARLPEDFRIGSGAALVELGLELAPALLALAKAFLFRKKRKRSRG